MKHRVLLNTKTNYLHITTLAVDEANMIELFSSSNELNNEATTATCIVLCKTFCLGYLLGNKGVKAANSLKDFQ